MYQEHGFSRICEEKIMQKCVNQKIYKGEWEPRISCWKVTISTEVLLLSKNEAKVENLIGLNL